MLRILHRLWHYATTVRQKSGLHSHSLQKKGKRAAAIRMEKCKIAIRIYVCVCMCLCLHEMDVNESKNISQYHERELEYHPSGASDGHFNLNALSSAATQYGGSSSTGGGQLDERRCSAATSPENRGSNDPRAQQQKVQQTVNSKKKRKKNPPAHMKATSSWDKITWAKRKVWNMHRSSGVCVCVCGASLLHHCQQTQPVMQWRTKKGHPSSEDGCASFVRLDSTTTSQRKILSLLHNLSPQPWSSWFIAQSKFTFRPNCVYRANNLFYTWTNQRCFHSPPGCTLNGSRKRLTLTFLGLIMMQLLLTESAKLERKPRASKT